MQLASYLERGPLIWMMPLHLHVNKNDYDVDADICHIMQHFIWVFTVYKSTCFGVSCIQRVTNIYVNMLYWYVRICGILYTIYFAIISS